MAGHAGITAEALVKRFHRTVALDGLDLDVPPGSLLALLGPNGAGKTTAVRILTTLLRPDSGRATVAGYDVAHQADALRSRIGLAGQAAAVDEYLTGRENLVMVARLYHLPRSFARERAVELLAQFELLDAADRPVKTYSGGMRRRLDLAASLVRRPAVLFLDEPTTGLDPRSRLALWETIRDLRRQGSTLLLTTQYLEEADALADRIVVMDAGRSIAEGTADELKRRVGADRVHVVVTSRPDLAGAASALLRGAGVEPSVDEEALSLAATVANGAAVLTDVVRELDAAGVQVADLAVRRPTLDDVFLSLTGRASAPEQAAPPAGRRRRAPVGRS